jgi:hypothetical protein
MTLAVFNFDVLMHSVMLFWSMDIAQYGHGSWKLWDMMALLGKGPLKWPLSSLETNSIDHLELNSDL